MEPEAGTAQACPRCQQADFNYEDLEEGTKLVCRDCGYVLDDVVLVHQRGYDDDGTLQAGVHVNEADDGRLAGAAVLAGAPRELLGPRTGGGSSSSSRHLVLSQQKERLDGAVSYLELPQNIATAARQLLPLVVSAYGKAEPRMHMSPATVAAVIYIAARQEGRALSLGMAAAAVTAAGPDVFKEFRRVVGVLNLEVPPPSLEATVMRAAPTMLQHFMPAPGGAGAGAGAISSGPLRGQPLVRKALQLTQLLMDVGAVDGRSPSVGAAAVWSIILAEDYKDAAARVYAKQVAGCLHHDPQAVQRHITSYEQHLSPLLSLLPYTPSKAADVGVLAARNAATLLKLQSLSRLAKPD